MSGSGSGGVGGGGTKTTKTKKTTLLIIDPQRDFHPGGSLAIAEADADAGRIAALIRTHATQIDRIVATMDTHQKLHIAKPSFWHAGDDDSDDTAGDDKSGHSDDKKKQQRHPDPFTVISADDLRRGKWKPRSDLRLPPNQLDATVFPDVHKVQDDAGNFDLDKYCLEYATRLEERGRFQLCVWPEHCLIGSEGHAVDPNVQEAMHHWVEETGGSVEWVMKGHNLLTEMYSALEADVPVSKETAFNEELFASLLESDRLVVCGQALSHCVNYTLRDIVARWPKERRGDVCLLTDCASAVPGFEAAADAFLKDMEAEGVRLLKSTDFS